MMHNAQSRREGSTVLIVMVVIVVVIILIFAIGIFAKPAPTLTDAESSGLVAFLRQNNIQAAVIQKLDSNNTGSVWVVKADGERSLIFSEELGSSKDTWGFYLPYYTFDITEGSAVNTVLLPDQAEVLDAFSGKIWDISRYVNGYRVDQQWHDIYAVEPLEKFGSTYSDTGSLGSLAIAPGGNYAVALNSSDLSSDKNVIEKIRIANGVIVSEPMSQPKAPVSYYGWSVDGRYALLTGDATYDLQQATTSPLIGNAMKVLESIGSDGPDGVRASPLANVGPIDPFIALISSSTILFEVSGVHAMNGVMSAGIYSAGPDGIASLLAPEEIKMVGLIK